MATTPLSGPVRVAVVGWGLSATVFHVPFMQIRPDRFVVTHVVERRSERSRALLPDATIMRSIEDVAACADVEMVVICTPSSDHFAHAKLAMEAGKHVVLEKPFAATLEEAAELVAIAERVKLRTHA